MQDEEIHILGKRRSLIEQSRETGLPRRINKAVCIFLQEYETFATLFRNAEGPLLNIYPDKGFGLWLISNIEPEIAYDAEEVTVAKYQLIMPSPHYDTSSLQYGDFYEKQSRTTYSYVDESKVIGRKDDIRKIVDMLLIADTPLSSSSSAVTLNQYEEAPAIITIVGLIGLGKTLLAQLVYNNYMSAYIFETKCDIQDMHSLVRKVQESLGGKKYLLVLDDLGSVKVWEKLKSALQVGVQEGSKIIITTRSHKVASVIGGTIPPYRLRRLTDDECWSIIKQGAFPIGGPTETANHVEVGKYLARKCYGFPLIALHRGRDLHQHIDETVGMELRVRTERLDKAVPALSFGLILPGLVFKYHGLPWRLKKCFSYFSMYHWKQKIHIESLIRFWIAEGFIELSDETNEMSMEDIGNQYINNLLGSPIFEDVEMDELDIKADESGCVKTFRLDCITHDFAREVAAGDCAIVKGTELGHITSIVRRVRLVSDEGVRSTCMPSDFHKNVRTIVGIQGIHSKEIKKIFSNKHLRVLELRNCGVGKLPDLSKLIHLRYLDLSDCQNILFVQSISSLWYLQTLVLRGCNSLTELPRDISTLINLRYLDASRTRVIVLPSEIGALKQLQHLDVSDTNIKVIPSTIKDVCKLRTCKFDCCRYLKVLPTTFADLKHLKCLDLSGTRIKELHESNTRCLYNLETLKLVQCKPPEDMAHLKRLKHLIYEGNETPRGLGTLTCLQTLQQYVVGECEEGIADLEDLNLLEKIRMCNLENVKDLVAAKGANLKGKQHIHCLDLHWSFRTLHSGYRYSDSEVLDALQPNANLKILKVKNFMGLKLPRWMDDSLSLCLPNLVELVLSGCSQCEQLPALGKLQYLRILCLRGMNSVRCLGKELYGDESSSSENSTPTPFPSLVELTLHSMKNLECWDASPLPSFPLLQKMNISFCYQLKAFRVPFPSLK
ncbi:putative disease resistance protein RGA1 [Papaver somniferum]|uniref:putative disease resistance protein RGA1 n=1 Tax=Papaver somniferum TaxID=3469 RepID=UPI000E6F97E7|nr:putative disease resistance protein RGA1 [Papaver somniferum]